MVPARWTSSRGKPALEKFDGKQHSIKVEMFQPGSEQNKLMKRRSGFATTVLRALSFGGHPRNRRVYR
ncbi:MAG: hypothetical protein Ct9H300mP1_34230 [Planctomycetaceae bacterium]|nr:MAG: hypothetical protein Ct9H300mP1_34230 [Planctomycetaceae bacterium]